MGESKLKARRESCGNCIYRFGATEQTLDGKSLVQLYCRREPLKAHPNVIMVERMTPLGPRQGPMTQWMSNFAPTKSTLWCGEWAAALPKRLTENGFAERDSPDFGSTEVPDQPVGDTVPAASEVVSAG